MQTTTSTVLGSPVQAYLKLPSASGCIDIFRKRSTRREGERVEVAAVDEPPYVLGFGLIRLAA